MRNADDVLDVVGEANADVAVAIQDTAESGAAAVEEPGGLRLAADGGHIIREETERGIEVHGSPTGIPIGFPKSTRIEAGSVPRGHENVHPVHEGEKLQKIIDSRHITQKELAGAGGFTKAAAHRWVNTAEFDRRMWANVRACMLKMRLDPTEIRPAKGTPVSVSVGTGRDLTKLVETWPDAYLRVLKEILTEDDDAARRQLLVYINGALRSIK